MSGVVSVVGVGSVVDVGRVQRTEAERKNPGSLSRTGARRVRPVSSVAVQWSVFRTPPPVAKTDTACLLLGT